ncbi:transcriptional regulator family: Fungal Specific TF [Penicillium odoratum]|uniref:transcriptional regulator family: Fungal Specific TF n=1 Tax=Penicillium odoratum TaxID=1167516 RepID=UPI0025496D7F|nr:transcriptional regulator family: Fungal Specific TF [Penicillium odoratum]KAJ5746307.1 transcriptional regulator family: Fungal Specific TF [Penicillium odoratum]
MPESKTKIRPQQSCLRCRERKVKCDRSIPCHACIIRGIEAECTYLTTPEDREHIGQAEIIERLRREVAQLRTQLSQGPRPRSRPRELSAERVGREHDRIVRSSGYAGLGKGMVSDVGGVIGYASAGGAGTEMTEGSWDGSSPSSSAMTHSLSVNSPDSTGSGTASHTQSIYQGSTFGTNTEDITTTTGTAFIGASKFFFSFMIETFQVPQVGSLFAIVCADGGIDFVEDTNLAHCQGGIPAFAPGELPASISMQNLQPVGIASQMYQGDGPHYAEDWGNAPYMQDYASYIPEVPAPHTNPVYEPQLYQHPQWGHGHQFMPAHQYPDSYSHSSSIGAFTANQDPLNVSQPLQSPQFLTHESLSQHPSISIPNSWTGKGKKELLETILETIGSCDEERVDQVVQVVRASATPEEAVSGICHVLGIGSGR